MIFLSLASNFFQMPQMDAFRGAAIADQGHAKRRLKTDISGGITAEGGRRVKPF